MYVYLVQHGASRSEAEDPQRGLSDDGQRVVELMAEYLTTLGITVDHIEHSEKLRARQTAEALAAKIKPQNGTKEISGLAPNDDITPMRKRLQVEEKDLMLVGHLPYLSRLLSGLLGVEQDHPLVEFRMGGAICLGRAQDGAWKLHWAVTPDLLTAPASIPRAA